MQPPLFFANPRVALRALRPDEPVLFLSPKALQENAFRFQNGFPGLVTYAVKANPHPTVLENLVAAGLSAFDVASPAEMRAVRTACPDATLHYNNPVRSRVEIAAGVDAHVSSWSVDDPGELQKLHNVPRGEVAVRFKLPITGAAYDFGDKFGATPEEAALLLRESVAMGFEPALCFHPGTQCTDAQAWVSYMRAAARIAASVGVRLKRLNVGGGFPQDRGQGAPDLEEFFAAIGQARQVFGSTQPALLCEPGRALVASTSTLAVRIKSRRAETIYLNDGIYGGMTELRDMGPSGLVTLLSPQGKIKTGPVTTFKAFGPTCDSLDHIPGGLQLPNSAAEDDYILIGGMGAYSSCLSTRFNGYCLEHLQTVAEVSGQCASAR